MVFYFIATGNCLYVAKGLDSGLLHWLCQGDAIGWKDSALSSGSTDRQTD